MTPMSEVTPCYIVTGSLTDEGTVAYLSPQGVWATVLADAEAFSGRAQAEARLAEVKPREAIVTEPYTFEASLSGGQIIPLSAREKLRAEGPSTRIRRPDPSPKAAS